MSKAIDPLSYITILIYAHGTDMLTKKVSTPDISLRKLTMAGKSGTLNWSLGSFPEGIFHRFQSAKLSNPGMRFDHLLQVVRNDIRETQIPDQLQSAYQNSSDLDKLISVQPELSEWVEFTSASYDHTYDFTQKIGENLPFGIWILDSSNVGLSLRHPKDIYCVSKRAQSVNYMKGDSILYGYEMGGFDQFEQSIPAQAITMSELATRLSLKYGVANVNIIDLSCRYVPPEEFHLLDDKVPSHLVSATPRVSKFGGKRISKKNKRRNRKSKKMYL
jgi:hypothetical protein